MFKGNDRRVITHGCAMTRGTRRLITVTFLQQPATIKKLVGINRKHFCLKGHL